MGGEGGERQERGREVKHTKLNPPPAAESSFPSYGPHIVVHCSARVRHSGTFCTLDYCIDELHAQQKFNVQGAVGRLRMQRSYAIQIDDQYAFTAGTTEWLFTSVGTHMCLEDCRLREQFASIGTREVLFTSVGTQM